MTQKKFRGEPETEIQIGTCSNCPHTYGFAGYEVFLGHWLKVILADSESVVFFFSVTARFFTSSETRDQLLNYAGHYQGDNLCLVGLMAASPSPSISFQHHPYQQEKPSESIAQEVGKEGLVYISNPIYDHAVVGDDDSGCYNSSKSVTPFETPESSPSRLESEDEDGGCEGDNKSPPLVPMKKLPLSAPSLTRSGTTDSNMASSSSHSFSPQCTSPSW